MRLYFLKSKRHTVLFCLFVFALVIILQLLVFIFLCLYRSGRIPDSFSQSKTPWVYQKDDFSFVIYNRNNLTDEGESYVHWLEQNEISFGVDDGVGVLSHEGGTAYYHVAIDGSSNFFETPVVVFSYSVLKTNMDNAFQEEMHYTYSCYSMSISMDKTTLVLNQDDAIEKFEDMAFEILGERACFTNQIDI